MTRSVIVGETISNPGDQKWFWIVFVAIVAVTAVLLALDDVRAAVLVFGPPLIILPLVMFMRAIEGSRLSMLAFLAISIFLLEAVFRVRDYDEKVVDFQILIKVGSWLLLLLLAAANGGKALKVVLSTASLPWTLLFTFLLITSLWAPKPEHAAVAASSILAFYLLFASMNDRISMDDLLLAVLAGILMLAIVSLIVYFAIPSFGRMHVWSGNVHVLSGRLSGIAGHPNTVGRLCCFGILIVAHQWKRISEMWRPGPLLIALLLSLVLVLSNSRTSITITIILLSIHFFARVKYIPYLLALVAVLLAGIMVFAPYWEKIMELLSRSGSAEEIETGTSRTHIWTVVEMLISQKPLFGWGYGSSVFVMPQYERLMGHAAPHAHNVMLQLWMTTGLVGLSLFLFALSSRFVIAAYLGERFIVTLLLFVLMNGITESSAFGGVANITTVALCIAASMVGAKRKLQASLSRPAAVNPDYGPRDLSATV